MTRLTALLLTVTALAWAACGNDDDPSATPAPRREPIRLGAGGDEIVLASALRPFDRCQAFLDHVKAEAAALVDEGWYPYPGQMRGLAATGAAMAAEDASAGNRQAAAAAPTTAAPKEGEDYSGTNVQEAGVDEPDLVKTDGKRLVTVARGNRLQLVDLTGGTPRVASTITLAEYGEQLFLAGDRVLVIGQGSFEQPEPAPMPAPRGDGRDGVAAPVPHSWQPASVVTVVDIADLARPRVVTTMRLEGAFVSGRLVNGRARLVVHAAPTPTVRPGAAPEDVKRAIEESGAGDWLPSYKQVDAAGNEVEGELVRCEDTYRPVDFSGPQTLTVVTVDPDDPKPGDTASVLGGAETVYASAENLYVSTSEYDHSGTSTRTQVHKFSIAGDGPAKYLASGEVPGVLLNQFSMSEHEGNLRVATTSGEAAAGSGSESTVTVLATDGEALKPIGQVGGLGRDERIYSVRFIGDMGYVVTFRQTDPLYVIDLSEPAKPEVKGELKILGYSAYLHPIGDGLLLGVGQDATEEGRRLGLQLSVFDVSDPANPTRRHQLSLRQLSSEAEYDHHAFLYWPRTGLTVLPVQTYEGRPSAVAFAVDAGDGIREKGRITHRAGSMVRRSIVVGDRLLTMSDAGLLVSHLDSLEEQGWVGFS